MSQFILDCSKAKILQISNDAFFYITEEEEPLDEENLEEAREILSMFPNSFYIKEDWKYVEDSDLIEATFIPYVEDNYEYDEYFSFTTNIQIQIKWLDANHIKAWWYNGNNGKRDLYGIFNVYTNEYGNKYFHTGNQDEEFIAGKNSLYFLKKFCKRNTKL